MRAAGDKAGCLWHAARPQVRESEAFEVSKRKTQSVDAIGESRLPLHLMVSKRKTQSVDAIDVSPAPQLSLMC
jgi:hypothetical protein